MDELLRKNQRYLDLDPITRKADYAHRRRFGLLTPEETKTEEIKEFKEVCLDIFDFKLDEQKRQRRCSGFYTCYLPGNGSHFHRVDYTDSELSMFWSIGVYFGREDEVVECQIRPFIKTYYTNFPRGLFQGFFTKQPTNPPELGGSIISSTSSKGYVWDDNKVEKLLYHLPALKKALEKMRKNGS